MAVARVERCLANIPQPENLTGQTLSADCKAAVWRHPVGKMSQVTFKLARLESTRDDRRLKLLPFGDVAGCEYPCQAGAQHGARLVGQRRQTEAKHLWAQLTVLPKF